MLAARFRLLLRYRNFSTIRPPRATDTEVARVFLSAVLGPCHIGPQDRVDDFILCLSRVTMSWRTVHMSGQGRDLRKTTSRLHNVRSYSRSLPLLWMLDICHYAISFIELIFICFQNTFIATLHYLQGCALAPSMHGAGSHYNYWRRYIETSANADDVRRLAKKRECELNYVLNVVQRILANNGG